MLLRKDPDRNHTFMSTTVLLMMMMMTMISQDIFISRARILHCACVICILLTISLSAQDFHAQAGR